MSSLEGKRVFITGASRGIGKAIALKAAKEGAKVIVAAKTTTEHPKLPGTIFDTVDEIEKQGGQALAVQLDIREEEQINAALEKTVETFGGIDVLINNASAIYLAPTLQVPSKRLDLMLDINVRGTFLLTQACLPYLKKADDAHILMLSPPLNMNAKWFKNHVAYTVSKYSMSMFVLGMAEELREAGISVNALWPQTAIATAAIVMLKGMVKPENCRTADIVADAAALILSKKAGEMTGQFLTDEEVLRNHNQTQFDQYAVKKGEPLLPDFFLEAS